MHLTNGFRVLAGRQILFMSVISKLVTRTLVVLSVFAHSTGLVCPGQSKQQVDRKIWQIRTHALTETLLADAVQIEGYDRALVWARLGEAWWRDDPEHAKEWFRKAVDAVESPGLEDKNAGMCRLATARTLLGVLSTRDKRLKERLVGILTDREENGDLNQRMENATALAEAGVAIVADDPQSAEKFGEASLRLGFSVRLATLLWQLHKRDPIVANRLFAGIVQAAVARADPNFFSMLITAAFNGPFSSQQEQRMVLSGLLQITQRPINGPQEATIICKLATFIPPLLPYIDSLFATQAQGVRLTLTSCHLLTVGEKQATDVESTRIPTTVDDFINAATKANNEADRDHYLLQGAQLAASNKQFERAIEILDMIKDGQQRLGETWRSLRWNFAASLACVHRKAEDLTAMREVIEKTPSNLRAFVRMSIVSTCGSFLTNSETAELLEFARRDLEKVPAKEQSAWYFALVRRFAKFSPDVAPAVLNEAVSAINRMRNNEPGDCSTFENISRVLTNQILMNQYTLPISLLESDEFGVSGAITSIERADIRAAVRLQLLKGMIQELRASSKVSRGQLEPPP